MKSWERWRKSRTHVLALCNSLFLFVAIFCSEAVIEFDAQMFQDDVPQDATETATKVLRVAKTRRYAIHSFGREVEWLEEGSKTVSDKSVHIGT